VPDGPGQVRRRSAYHGSPIGASAVQIRRKTSRGSRLRHRQRRREKANIRANKPVPERRTQLHAVAQEPRDDHLDETKCDGAGRSDTTCDSIELPTDQKVGDSSSSERADQGFVRRKNPNSAGTVQARRLSEGWGFEFLRAQCQGLCESRDSNSGGTAQAKHLI
jgi:hypothetical protein